MIHKIMGVYQYPVYYEIAFSFRNITKEVDFIEKCIRKFSRTKVRNILEIGCGNSPYLEEIHKRGYKFSGLDSSKEMLEFTKKKAEGKDIPTELVKADMRNFRLKKKYDLAFVMLGSIFHSTNKEFLSHLDSIANVLKKGALYIIDASIKFDLFKPYGDEWTRKRNGIKVKTIYQANDLNNVKQIFLEKFVFKVDDNGKKRTIKSETVRKYVFPQEFLALVELNKKFEFVGWFNNFNLNQPIEKAKKIDRPLTILRKV